MESQVEQAAGGEGAEPSSSTPIVTTASSVLISRIVDYIANLAPRLLFDAVEPSEALMEALTSKSGHKAISRFLTDSKVSAIFLESPIVPGGKACSIHFLHADADLPIHPFAGVKV